MTRARPAPSRRRVQYRWMSGCSSACSLLWCLLAGRGHVCAAQRLSRRSACERCRRRLRAIQQLRPLLSRRSCPHRQRIAHHHHHHHRPTITTASAHAAPHAARPRRDPRLRQRPRPRPSRRLSRRLSPRQSRRRCRRRQPTPHADAGDRRHGRRTLAPTTPQAACGGASDTLLSPDHANIVAYVAISVVLGVAALALIAFGVRLRRVRTGATTTTSFAAQLDNLNGRRNGRSPPDPIDCDGANVERRTATRYSLPGVHARRTPTERDLAFHTREAAPRGAGAAQTGDQGGVG
jgi:hypothetical protein